MFRTHYSFMSLLFFFNDTATTEIYTLSLHDALPIFVSVPSSSACASFSPNASFTRTCTRCGRSDGRTSRRSEEHTSELQSQSNLVCRLLLEKKKTNIFSATTLIRPITIVACSRDGRL